MQLIRIQVIEHERRQSGNVRFATLCFDESASPVPIKLGPGRVSGNEAASPVPNQIGPGRFSGTAGKHVNSGFNTETKGACLQGKPTCIHREGLKSIFSLPPSHRNQWQNLSDAGLARFEMI